MSRQCSIGWQSMWIATTFGKPARRGRPVATLQSAATPWQGLVTWHPGSKIVHNHILNKRILAIPNDQRTSKNALPLALQLTLTAGVILKVQNSPARCLQSQLLVTSKMFDSFKVSQDFMWAMSQHGNVFAADATIEVASFASRICIPSDEETTHFICSSDLLHFVSALWPHTSAEMTRLWLICAGVTRVSNTWTRRCRTLSQMLKDSI